ncbi:hypothetical protein WJX81_001528 [Elliptochloris bilobata]|uniref:LAGLIDADG homing endonuclease n=1 Tax=Elliptochloris bilobata TaxID=381761 RepID=A0AAW1RWV6_9CHLO
MGLSAHSRRQLLCDVLMPANKLKNRSFLVRAGEGELEASGTVLTNPVWKTSTYSGLSTRGRAQVIRQTYPALEELEAGACRRHCLTSLATTKGH